MASIARIRVIERIGGPTMTNLQRSGFSDLDRLLELVGRTRELLDMVAGESELPEWAAEYIATTTMPHFVEVQAGFHGSLRSDMADIGELRYLLTQVAAFRVDAPRTDAERRAAHAEAVAEWRADAHRGRRIQVEGARSWPLAAVGHARVVLALLPQLPPPAVRFPAGRRTYADIPTPHGPAELADRIAELETSLWRIVRERTVRTTDPAFRRTYGFFDTADQLGLRGFLGAA